MGGLRNLMFFDLYYYKYVLTYPLKKAKMKKAWEQ
jgi:hypothetical protein